MAIRRSTDVPRPVAASVPTRPAAPTAPATPSEPVGTGFTAAPPTAARARLAELRALMAGRTDRAEEGRILSLFRDAPVAELNQVLGAMSRKEVHALVSDLDDRLFGPDNKTAFLELLTKTRVGDLTVESRAKVVQALQLGGTDKLEEKAITAVFLATKGEGLTQLKNAIDQGGDYHDLQQLVFHDIDSKARRGQLLAHFEREAPAKGARVKVLSDIDDTFYVNLKDDRFPKKTVYPGVKAFYAELDRGAGRADPLGDLMFLSARPYDRPGLVEHMTRETMEKHGVTPCTVLSGDLAHVVGNERIADKKFENWAQVTQLYPEYGSVFIGDSGQGDAIFGARAAATRGGDMRAVFIHDVTHLDAAAKADFARQGVFIFDTYVGAATEAFKRGLIDKAGLSRVMEDAQHDFKGITFTSDAQQAARRVELERDLAAARALL